MGLRKWVSRPLRGHHIGVENLIAGGDGIPVSVNSTDSHVLKSRRA
jgi:hypothetical protein